MAIADDLDALTAAAKRLDPAAAAFVWNSAAGSNGHLRPYFLIAAFPGCPLAECQ